MSDIIYQIATWIGLIFLAACIVSGSLVLLFVIFTYFPMRTVWLAWKPPIPKSYVLFPGNKRYHLTAIIGLCSRRKTRWFFGFHLMKEDNVTIAEIMEDNPRHLFKPESVPWSDNKESKRYQK